jgi:hypothetical protein
MDEAFRITLEYDGEKLSLKSIRRVAMRVPRGQTQADIARNPAGRFLELRGADDELLYRRAVGQLIPPTIEYPTGDPAQPFGRAKPPRGASFSVLVPVRKGARRVSIVESGGATAKASARGTRDLFTADLPGTETGR